NSGVAPCRSTEHVPEDDIPGRHRRRCLSASWRSRRRSVGRSTLWAAATSKPLGEHALAAAHVDVDQTERALPPFEPARASIASPNVISTVSTIAIGKSVQWD